MELSSGIYKYIYTNFFKINVTVFTFGKRQLLSDAYIDNKLNSPVSLELTVKIININSTSGNDILNRCEVLNEYSQFVEAVRHYRSLDEDNYMKSAIEYCIQNHVLEEYLKRKGSDVMGFLCAEYDYELDMKVQREESYETGLEKGIEALILDYIEEGFSRERICEKLIKRFSLSEDEAENAYQRYSQLYNIILLHIKRRGNRLITDSPPSFNM